MRPEILGQDAPYVLSFIERILFDAFFVVPQHSRHRILSTFERFLDGDDPDLATQARNIIATWRKCVPVRQGNFDEATISNVIEMLDIVLARYPDSDAELEDESGS